jgi:hypothetical protein
MLASDDTVKQIPALAVFSLPLRERAGGEGGATALLLIPSD